MTTYYFNPQTLEVITSSKKNKSSILLGDFENKKNISVFVCPKGDWQTQLNNLVFEKQTAFPAIAYEVEVYITKPERKTLHKYSIEPTDKNIPCYIVDDFLEKTFKKRTSNELMFFAQHIAEKVQQLGGELLKEGYPHTTSFGVSVYMEICFDKNKRSKTIRISDHDTGDRRRFENDYNYIVSDFVNQKEAIINKINKEIFYGNK